MKKLRVLLVLMILTLSCKQNENKKKSSTTAKDLPKNQVERIEIAHQKNVLLKNEAISFDAKIKFGNNEIFNANITITTNSDLAKISYKNGEEIFIDQQEIFVSPSLVDNNKVRFHAYTWSYFFLFPYKLSDNGTIWDFNFKTNETKNKLQTFKLSFSENTGDAPEDWYITYTNEYNVIQHVAYIVTAGTSKEKAEEDPHAIQYQNYKKIDGVPFATKWIFYEWNSKDGLTNQIGYGIISNIKFINDFRENFSIPKDYIKK